MMTGTFFGVIIIGAKSDNPRGGRRRRVSRRSVSRCAPARASCPALRGQLLLLRVPRAVWRPRTDK